MKDQDLNGQFLLALGCSNEMRFSMGFIWEKSSSFLERCGRTVIWNFWLTIPRGFLHSHFQLIFISGSIVPLLVLPELFKNQKIRDFVWEKPCVRWDRASRGARRYSAA
jgi:hypothetical protein